MFLSEFVYVRLNLAVTTSYLLLLIPVLNYYRVQIPSTHGIHDIIYSFDLFDHFNIFAIFIAVLFLLHF